ncbi:MAG: helix-turn-helix transcriptional regulator [Dorea sp.]|nr:helix-turn-helix transcriptional regulator [Dorea sp.]
MRLDGMKIENQMARKQMMLKTLSERSGVSRPALRLIIRGEYEREVRTDTAGRISQALECDIADIRA